MFVKKLRGCVYRKGRVQGRLSLIEVHRENGEFLSFVLHLKLDGTRAARTIYLKEKEEEREEVCRRYLPQCGKSRRSFPGLRSNRWQPGCVWLDDAAKRCPQKNWMRVKKTRAMSRFKRGVCPRIKFSNEMKRLLKMS